MALSTPLLALFVALVASAQSPWPELDRRPVYGFFLEGVAYPGGPNVYDKLEYCEGMTAHPKRAKKWIRTAIYDSLDYDPVTHTGGLDASIFYEIDRLPLAIQDDVRTTAQDLEAFTSKHLSRTSIARNIPELIFNALKVPILWRVLRF